MAALLRARARLREAPATSRPTVAGQASPWPSTTWPWLAARPATASLVEPWPGLHNHCPVLCRKAADVIRSLEAVYADLDHLEDEEILHGEEKATAKAQAQAGPVTHPPYSGDAAPGGLAAPHADMALIAGQVAGHKQVTQQLEQALSEVRRLEDQVNRLEGKVEAQNSIMAMLTNK